MPLTPDQEQALRDEAAALGLDPEALLAAGRAAVDAGEDTTGHGNPIGDGAAAPAAAKEGRALHPNGVEVLLGHYPWMRLREIRQLYGYTDQVPDGDLFYDEWLKKRAGNNTPPTT